MQEPVTNVVVSGCNNPMGKLIADLVNEHPNWRVCCGYDSEDGFSPLGFPIFGYANQIKGQVVPKPNLIIDCSHPEATLNMYHMAIELSIPMVTITRGLSLELIYMMKTQSRIAVFQEYDIAKQTKILISHACSLAKSLASIGVYDVDVEETVSYNEKPDEISSTAYKIACSINAALGNTHSIVTNSSKDRENNEIRILLVEEDTCASSHKVVFNNKEESSDHISIEHVIDSPIIFAKGAISAAEFVLDQSPGLYNIDNL